MNFELRHPQAPAPLLSAGQGGNLYGKGSDILLIPHIEIVPGQVDGGGVVVGLPVVCGAEGHSAFFCFPSQVPDGVVNMLIGMLGGEPIPFMESASAFPHMYVWSGVWSSAGWGSIIYLATLSNVDPQHYEAATLDGATKLQKIWYTTLPVLIPTAVTLFILDVGHVMNVGFEKAYAMQNDLNRTSSQVLATYVYTQGIKDGNYSFSTAISLFNSVINLVLICTVNFISRKISEVSLW